MSHLFRMWSRLLKRNRKQITRRQYATEAPGTITNSMVKKALLRPTVTPRMFTLAALVACGTAFFTYYNERNFTPEALLSVVLTKISSDDPSIKSEGFKELESALCIQKRFYSGEVAIPVPPRAFATKQVMSGLLDNLSGPHTRVALYWIYKLTNSDDTPRPVREQARKALLEADPNLEKISTLLKEPDYEKSQNWILASHIILGLNDYSSKLPLEPTVTGLTHMATSQNAAAIAHAALIAKNLPPEILSDAIREILSKNVSAEYSSQVVKLVGGACIDNATVQLNKQTNNFPAPLAGFLSLVVVPLFGAVWGRTLWGISSNSNPEYRKLKNTYGQDVTEPLRKKFIKSRKIGLSLFLLLSFDLLASYVPQILTGSTSFDALSLGKNEWKGQELSVIYPAVQTGLFTLTTIALINRYRFVLVPLLLGGVINHFDLIENSSFVNTISNNKRF